MSFQSNWERKRHYVTRFLSAQKELKDLGWTFLGSGRHREVYLSPDKKYVCKLAYYGCEQANKVEWNRWRLKQYNNDEIPLAQVISLFEYNEVSILIMEYVSSLQSYVLEDLPTWTDFVDCQQVGYNSKGELVAYDYGM